MILKWFMDVINGAKWLIATAIGAISIGLALYAKGRSDEKAKLKELQALDDNKRMKNVLKADANVRADINANGLYKSDGFRRD